jgi:hypothetical protein
MEASEKLTLTEDPTVRVLDGRLVIERLAVEDERTARVVRERMKSGHEPPATVRDAIEIGARVLEREGTAAEVDYIQREFEKTAGQVREQFTEQARGLTETVQSELEKVFGDDSGLMARALEAHADELAEQISRHFGDESSEAVQHRVKELVEKTMRDSRDSLIRHLSSDDGANPLADFKSGVNRTVVEAVRVLKEEEKATREKLEGLQAEVVRLTEQSEAKRQLAEAEEAGTRKGRSFEDLVFSAVERIADARGDAAEHVGDEPGAGGSKKGDVVVEIGAADGPSSGRVVFEVKDSRLTKPKAWAELNGAMEARSATFAVLIVAGEHNVPAGQQELHEYEGDKLIVAVDPEHPDQRSLELAYRYARCRVLMRRENELSMDAAGVRDAAAAARECLDDARAIRSALTTARNGVDRARTGVDAMVDTVLERIERIEALVADAESPEAAA